ncbi:MAG: hypothetical protein U0586_07915 [Candidatus Brocadiaceae bacterium]
MKDLKLLVIAKTSNERTANNLLQGTTQGQPLPKGVKQLADNSWLIELRTCLPFFVSLSHSAQYLGIPLSVLPTENEIISLHPSQK